MKEIIYNYDNLKDDDITELVTRIKVLLLKNGKLLIGNENGVFQFIGGHLEEGENFKDCLKREVLEETGIELEENEIIKAFMKTTYLNKDWPEKGKNRKCEIYYYVVNTDKNIDLNKTKYTENEKQQNFKIEELPLNDSIKIIEDNIPNNEMNKVISPEMIVAINEYLYQCEN